MEKSVLFFDIDGTILSEKTGKIPESAIRALRKAQENGHLLFINTGRTVCAIPKELEKIRFDGWLYGCGTHLVYQGEVMLSSSIPEKRGKDLIEKIKECGLGGVAEGQEDIYFPKEITRFEGLEGSKQYFASQGMGIGQYLEEEGVRFDKLFVFSDEKSDLASFFAYIEEDMEVIDRGKNTYEIIQKGYTKATACDFVMEQLGIPRERAYVFGDSGNDLAMFEYAQHAVAMGKHAEILEPYTEFVTKTVEEDGIEYALKHYGLI